MSTSKKGPLGALCFSLGLLSALLQASTARQEVPLDLSSSSGGVLALDLTGMVPDGKGVFVHRQLALPACTRVVWFGADWWPGGGNRLYPRFQHTGELAQGRQGGAMLLMQRTDGGWLCVLPVSGRQAFGWIDTNDGREFTLCGGHLGKAPVSGEELLCGWARAPDAYTAIREAWKTVLADRRFAGTARARQTKVWPEVFDYLGWCSWESFHLNISESVLTSTMSGLEASGLPVRWVLIDDGHQNVRDNREAGLNWLDNLEPVAAKFPRGFAPILSLRKPDRIRWVGIWLSFLGGRDGMSPGSVLDEVTVPVASGGRLPGLGGQAARSFFERLLDGHATRPGFDFVKVDFQSRALTLYTGGVKANVPVPDARAAVPNPLAAAVAAAHGFQSTAVARGFPVMNCNSLNAVSIFNSGDSVLARCSEDYAVGNLGKARTHLFYSYASMPWLGQTMWGDHDMFHSSDKVSAQLMARSKALSGGPMYVSDPPSKLDAAMVRPLCFEDGKVLRPLAPAAPAPASLTVNPLSERKAYKVLAPLANGAAMVAVYNLYARAKVTPRLQAAMQAAGLSPEQQGSLTQFLATEPLHDETLAAQLRKLAANSSSARAINQLGAFVHGEAETASVTAAIEAGDYENASVMMQPYPGPWRVPPEGLVWFEQATNRMGRLTAPLVLELPKFGDRMVQLSAIRDGWAVVGDPAKYLSAAAVEVARWTASRLEFSVREPATVLIWTAGAVSAEGAEVRALEGGFWEARVVSPSSPVRLSRAR